ncbi:MAG: hypothetical protein KME60_28565 [Cyanomargarita calcarea GSE-NOS-MK-12-04C]|uniref:Uncharacterized protein n=1 Tax=Cyanomargarita calcarea GSE-NOS-MK-12-04C TaxID=2839659 RepID=A0A951QT67_9CYAN|nr:hypothetical protein [Cyanomargarita calcarea GSE-NOS-MK-12-04C]
MKKEEGRRKKEEVLRWGLEPQSKLRTCFLSGYQTEWSQGFTILDLPSSEIRG